jgi:hypothetical protein
MKWSFQNRFKGRCRLFHVSAFFVSVSLLSFRFIPKHLLKKRDVGRFVYVVNIAPDEEIACQLLKKEWGTAH